MRIAPVILVLIELLFASLLILITLWVYSLARTLTSNKHFVYSSFCARSFALFFIFSLFQIKQLLFWLLIFRISFSEYRTVSSVIKYYILTVV